MVRRAFLEAATLSVVLVTFQDWCAQAAFTNGYYQINGGTYAECCGIVGDPFVYPLSDENQGFVELIIDPGGASARLTFLAPDMHTVFTTSPSITASGFPFTFGNGVVFSNYIRFVSGAPIAAIPMASWSYTVTNLGSGIGISGAVVTSPLGSDLPNRFEHTNVVASLVPNSIVIDRVEHDGSSVWFHFSGLPPYDYAVESTDSLTETNWHSFATYRAKLQTIEVTVTNLFTDAQMRFFRVQAQPCDCR